MEINEKQILLGEYNALKNFKRQNIELVVRKETGIQHAQPLPKHLEKIINRTTAHAIVGEFRERGHADTDVLTGIKNRRGYNNALSEKIASGDTDIGIMHADMRQLKIINDKFGHQGGDQAIKKVASTLKETSRSSDTISRYGGDEFAGIISTKEHHISAIPHSPKDMLATAGLRMCAAVQNKALYIGNEQVSLHADIGLSEFAGEVHETEHLADQASYIAKRITNPTDVAVVIATKEHSFPVFQKASFMSDGHVQFEPIPNAVELLGTMIHK